MERDVYRLLPVDVALRVGPEALSACPVLSALGLKVVAHPLYSGRGHQGIDNHAALFLPEGRDAVGSMVLDEGSDLAHRPAAGANSSVHRRSNISVRKEATAGAAIISLQPLRQDPSKVLAWLKHHCTP